MKSGMNSVRKKFLRKITFQIELYILNVIISLILIIKLSGIIND